MVMESADWLNHATEELLQQRRLLHADSDEHETVAKGNPEVKRINGSTNSSKYCLFGPETRKNSQLPILMK